MAALPLTMTACPSSDDADTEIESPENENESPENESPENENEILRTRVAKTRTRAERTRTRTRTTRADRSDPRQGFLLAEREAQRLGPGVEELDLEEPVDDRPGLTDQLVHPLLDQCP